MGEASRRKKLGEYPEQTPKPKTSNMVVGYGSPDTSETLMMAALMMGAKRHSKLPRMED